ncbi:MAG: radical SAM protein [Myxococcales bacterium]|nr:radical SAM protein [Myxococcales bacterium]USN49853.1 MAG: radical SAM protein [Myxococcales bacterium]
MSARRLNVLSEQFFPAYVVWELTLKCDQKCVHCGSRASKPRKNELNSHDALKIVQQLSEQGTREVVLIGGEAYLHQDFLSIVQALVDSGINVGMTSGGKGIDEDCAMSMKNAGLSFVSISIDGLKKTHDTIRANKGSFDSALQALKHLKENNIRISVNTNINRINMIELEEMYELFFALKISSWQVQITAPLGRAADRPHMLLQPYDLLNIVPRIAKMKERAFKDGFLIMPGNNLGYFGPEESLLRSMRPEDSDHWLSCQAGKFIMGIESDGGLKGCPSLQSEHYLAGNLRKNSLRDLWENSVTIKKHRIRGVKDLWGFCARCDFKEICLGGCTFTSHSVFDRPGNNPYCHYRALKFKSEGKRERLIKIKNAPNKAFDNGKWELIEEPFDSKEPELINDNLIKICKKLR